MANTRGVFFLSKITEEKIPLEEWVDLESVWHDPVPAPTPNTGYFGGGEPTNNNFLSQVDKIDFSTDTTTFTPSANLSVGRGELAAVGNQISGYFGGGERLDDPSPSRVTTIDKVNYSNDTTSEVPGAKLSSTRSQLAATGNMTDGYFGGGFLLNYQ